MSIRPTGRWVTLKRYASWQTMGAGAVTGVLEGQIAALGEARAMVVDCLGGNGRFTPVPFTVGPDGDYMAAFRAFMKGNLALPGGEAEPPIVETLLAAGRLLMGEIGVAGRIVDEFPTEPFRVDHGAGYCNGAHLAALRWAVPLPDRLRDIGQWVAGSAEQAAIRAWLAEFGSGVAVEGGGGTVRRGTLTDG